MSADLFVSYARKDREQVQPWIQRLRHAGVSIWLDEASIDGASRWGQQIAEAIDGCKALLLIVSSASAASAHVVKELALATEESKPILPLMLEPVAIPMAMRYHLAGIQQIELFDREPDETLPTILRALTGLGITPAAPAAAPDPVQARTNVPRQLTRFIGREQETAEIRRLLATTSLLTLTGPGGTGKTSLALQVASDVLGEFADGVFFVTLAPIRDPALVAATIAQTLEVRETGDRPLLEHLKGFLRDRELLLVLDNLEQVVAAAPQVAELLAACPRLKALVTSREALRVRGEKEYPVPPLALPDPKRLPPLDRLTEYAAVALFIERAQAVQPDFAVTPENAPAVVEICCRLDGLPLAIELAAARIKLLPPPALLGRLSSRLKLLTGGARDLPERQQTLRGAIAWSHDLLDEGEKTLFRRLTAFVGGCTLEAAEAVCNADGSLKIDVLDGMASLMDKSLLRQQEAGGEPRFRMLETIREYGQECLTAAGEADAIRREHARFFLELAEAAAPRLQGADQEKWLERLALENDNLRAALEWARERREDELCARLALALFEPFHRQGLWEEARACLQAGWTANEALGGDPRRRAALSHNLAIVADDMGDLAEARRQAEASLALRRQLDDSPGIADSLNLLGLFAIEAGDTEASEQFLREAWDRLEAQDHFRRGKVLHNLSHLASRRGDTVAAQRQYEEALSCRRAAGDVRGEAETLGNLGVLGHLAGDHAEARRLYHESLALRRVLRDRLGIAVMLNNLGELAELDGDADTAVVLFVHAERLFRDLQSAYVSMPQESLQRLAGQPGAERWVQVRAAAERTSWEEILQEGDPVRPNM